MTNWFLAIQSKTSLFYFCNEMTNFYHYCIDATGAKKTYFVKIISFKINISTYMPGLWSKTKRETWVITKLNSRDNLMDTRLIKSSFDLVSIAVSSARLLTPNEANRLFCQTPTNIDQRHLTALSLLTNKILYEVTVTAQRGSPTFSEIKV